MMFRVENLSFSYRNGPVIFHDVSFGLGQGEVLTILGANGAGKSTLLNCLACLTKPNSGDIYFEGKKIADMDKKAIAQRIGYVPQTHVPAYAYSVREFVVMGRTPYISTFSRPSKDDYRIAEEALERLGIERLRDRAYTELSGGERQQVTIARVLAQQPKLILLDEPTAHLDYGNQFRAVNMVSRLASEGYAVIITTHTPDHAFMLGGKTALLDAQGCVSVGETDQAVTADSLSHLYGLDVQVSFNQSVARKVCAVRG